MTWELSHYRDTYLRNPDLQKALDDGWEPFAVIPGNSQFPSSSNIPIVYLRRLKGDPQ